MARRNAPNWGGASYTLAVSARHDHESLGGQPSSRRLDVIHRRIIKCRRMVLGIIDEDTGAMRLSLSDDVSVGKKGVLTSKKFD